MFLLNWYVSYQHFSWKAGRHSCIILFIFLQKTGDTIFAKRNVLCLIQMRKGSSSSRLKKGLSGVKQSSWGMSTQVRWHIYLERTQAMPLVHGSWHEFHWQVARNNVRSILFFQVSRWVPGHNQRKYTYATLKKGLCSCYKIYEGTGRYGQNSLLLETGSRPGWSH